MIPEQQEYVNERVCSKRTWRAELSAWGGEIFSFPASSFLIFGFFFHMIIFRYHSGCAS